MKALLLGAVVFGLAASVLAQKFDIFDPDDFVDPRERGAIFDGSGFAVTKDGDRFSLVRAYTGRVSDYQSHDTPTSANVTFVHVAWNRYRSNYQVNYKLALFDVDSSVRVPRYRGTAELARYFAIGLPGKNNIGPKDEVRAAGRILVSASLEENPNRNLAGEWRRALDHEFGVQLDAYVRSTRPQFSTIGSLVCSRRIVDQDRYATRVMYFDRGPDLTLFNERLRLNGSFALGGEHIDSWHSIARIVATASVEIPSFKGNLNVAYAPTYLPGAGDRRIRHEVAIYIDRTMMAHLAPALPRK